MMIELLENDFKITYGLVRNLNVNQIIYSTDFSLHDPKACNNCPEKDTCNQQVAIFICEGKDATVIEYEDFINSLQGTKAGEGKKCDCIVYTSDNGKFILNEQSCSKQQYIESERGKRATAVCQFNETITKLYRVNNIKDYIQKYSQCIGLFTYRLKDLNGESTGLVENSMNNFFKPLKFGPVISQKDTLNEHFTFIQVIYPGEYEL